MTSTVSGQRIEPLPSDAHRVRRSLPIRRAPTDLQRLWLDPQVQRAVMAQMAELTSADDDVWHWKAHAPVIGDLEWDARVVVEEPGRRIAWQSLDGGDLPNRGTVEFRDATDDWGTGVTLTWIVDPPAGKLGDAVAGATHLPAAIAATTLRRFKSIAETGEVPTLARTPAARDEADPYGAFQ